MHSKAGTSSSSAPTCKCSTRVHQPIPPPPPSYRTHTQARRKSPPPATHQHTHRVGKHHQGVLPALLTPGVARPSVMFHQQYVLWFLTVTPLERHTPRHSGTKRMFRSSCCSTVQAPKPRPASQTWIHLSLHDWPRDPEVFTVTAAPHAMHDQQLQQQVMKRGVLILLQPDVVMLLIPQSHYHIVYPVHSAESTLSGKSIHCNSPPTPLNPQNNDTAHTSGSSVL